MSSIPIGLPQPTPMRVLLVTYDLKTPGRDYAPFFKALQEQGKWWHYISSTWLIVTSKTPVEVYNAICPNLSMQDFILITPMAKTYWGFLPKDAWDWITANSAFLVG